MKSSLVMIAAVTSLMALPTSAVAQNAARIEAPGRFAPIQAPCVGQADGSCAPVSATTPLPTAAKQEALQLAIANTSAAPATVYGGAYVFSQACTAYGSGSLALRYRGPDGAAMLLLASKNASDAGGGTLVSLGSGAVVDVALPTGSTGCNATLARVPQ